MLVMCVSSDTAAGLWMKRQMERPREELKCQQIHTLMHPVLHYSSSSNIANSPLLFQANKAASGNTHSSPPSAPSAVNELTSSNPYNGTKPCTAPNAISACETPLNISNTLSLSKQASSPRKTSPNLAVLTTKARTGKRKKTKAPSASAGPNLSFVNTFGSNLHTSPTAAPRAVPSRLPRMLGWVL